MERKARWLVQAAVALYRFTRILAAVPCLLLAVLPPAAAQSTELTPIVVALPEGPSPRTIGYYLAEAGGWFARAGLDPRAGPGECHTDRYGTCPRFCRRAGQEAWKDRA